MKILFLLSSLSIVLFACSGSQTPLPKGPPPEYEDEPSVTAPAPAAADAGVEQ